MSPLIWPRLAATTIGALAAAVGAYGPTMINRYVSFMIVILAATGLYQLVLLPFRKRPSSFAVRNGSFVVPAHPQQGLIIAFMGAWVGYQPSAIVGLVIFALFHLSWLPRLRLTPEGLESRGIRTWKAKWEELAPGHPADPIPKERSLVVYSLRKNVWVRKYLDLTSRYVDLPFLARTIRHYIDHHEGRAAIGQQSELDRLKGALSGSPA